MTDSKPLRIDKFLWAARIYKTRTQAADDCIKGRVLFTGIPVKPSRTVNIGDIITIRKPPVTYTYRVLALAKNRVGPAIVPQLIENLTPEEEIVKLEMKSKSFSGYRMKGSGRPTKKDRRNIDKWIDDINYSE